MNLKIEIPILAAVFIAIGMLGGGLAYFENKVSGFWLATIVLCLIVSILVSICLIKRLKSLPKDLGFWSTLICLVSLIFAVFLFFASFITGIFVWFFR